MANKIGNARHLDDEAKDLVGKKLPICIDFDGSCVFHHFPSVGKEAPHCVETLKKWVDGGVGLILDTMRSGKELDDAVQWFKDNDIELYGVGKEPSQHKWTSSNKCYGILSIDDRNVGCPLIFEKGERPCVDWKTIDEKYTEAILDMAKKYCK